jgi:hypothetical protein
MHCLQRHLQGRSWNSTLPSFHESIELRTSTLAALVIAGGTIAALPFRRFSSDMDEPAPATGPTSSVLGEAEFPILKSVAHDRHQSQISAAPSPGQRIELPPWDASTPDIEPERRVDLPLTFDDLMLPIDRPRPIAEQFEAVVDRSVAPEPPPSDRRQQVSDRFSGVVSEPENEPRIQSAPSLPPAVSGSLATSKIPAEPDKPVSTDPPLAPKPAVRDRAWIRQP